ncbi:D-inositol 3-phosphate glycosyltransferase [subsurface metagenome]
MAASQLRVAVLSVHSCPVGNLGARDTGGMSIYVRELARELGKQGFLVDVYTRVHEPDGEPIIKLGRNARLIHLRAGRDENIHKLAVYRYLPEFARNLESFRRRNNLRYDLIFSHYWLSGWVGESLQCWWDVPHIMVFHTLGAVKNFIGLGEEEPELRIETERHLAGNGHNIIATTEKEKKELIRHYGASPERITVIPCGVNLDLFQPMDKKMAKQQLGFGDDNIILFAGRLEPLKGIDQLLRAMVYLQNGQRPRLVIIGGDEDSQHEMERLKKLSRALRIQDSVTFLGLIEHEELPCFYSAADVCVVPSYYESFGLVALESLACGTPVVATDVGSLKSVIHQGETGYVVADNTPSHLTDKIALLLSKQNDGMRTAAFIRASVTPFSWTNIAQQIIKEWRKLLAGCPVSGG